jgi:hypothetical protein
MQSLRFDKHWPWLVGLALMALLPFMPRISRDESHFGRMVLAALALGLVQGVFWLRSRSADAEVEKPEPERASRVLLALWIALVVYGGFNYYQFRWKMLGTVDDHADATYYYLNSKYFSEIGYDHLYEAMLVADREGPHNLDEVKRYRDLTTYKELHPTARAISRAPEIKALFAPERWSSFVTDVAFLTSRGAKGGFEYFFIDHGYNPPPPWTLVGGALSELVPVEHLKWLTSIDILLITALMIAIARVWSVQAMLIALAFYLCTFSGRWPVLGQSILRFDWVSALVACVIALRSKRHGLAGAFFAYAACNRIFPAIFALPYAAWALREWSSTRRMPEELKRFAIGALAVTCLLVGGAWLRYGTHTFIDARDRLALHGSPESFSSHRVGLGHVALYRGEWTRKEINRAGGIDKKRADLWAIYPYLKIVGVVLAALAFVYAWRSKEPPHRLFWLSIFPLFALTNPQINYYNLRLLLVLFHTERFRVPIDRVGLSLLFATEIATQAMHIAGADRYAVTAVTSIGLLTYLTAMAVFLGRELLQGKPASSEVTSKAAT